MKAFRVGLVALTLSALLPSGARSQNSAALVPLSALKFEVASVKRAFFPSDAYFSGFSAGAGTCGIPRADISGERVTIRQATLCGLIRLAYGVRDFQIAGIPDSMRRPARSNFYDTDTRTGAGIPTREQMTTMLKALLADRFQLQLHHEMREVPVYALTVVGKGPIINKHPEVCAGWPKVIPRIGPGVMANCAGQSMGTLATDLSRHTDRPVVDRTGLSDKYPFELKWDTVNGAPSLFTAIQEQLGLKLVATRAPFDVLVIDQVERQTEN
jgi:uncharacterized protein (TIGR03435 family)